MKFDLLISSKSKIQVHALIFKQFEAQNWSKRDTHKGEFREYEVIGEGTYKWIDDKKYIGEWERCI